METATNGSFGLDRLILGYVGKDFDVCLCDLQMPVGVLITTYFVQEQSLFDPPLQPLGDSLTIHSRLSCDSLTTPSRLTMHCI